VPDVIPGAIYLDTVHDSKAHCNGVTRDDDGRRVVVLDYNGLAEPFEIDYELFRADGTYQLVEHP